VREEDCDLEIENNGIEQCSIQDRRLRTGEDFALIDYLAHKEACGGDTTVVRA
jgi:hypothetical protein